MILYTPLSLAEIFPVQQDKINQRSVIIHQNRSVYVEKNEDGNYQVVQLLSTDPIDFMNAQYQPGSILPAH